MRSTWCGPERRRTLRLALADTALIWGAVVSVLALGEGTVRALDLGPRFEIVFTEVFRRSANPVLQYELRPGARDGAHRISGAGLRDRDFPPRPAPGSFRIAALGDSVTYGMGVERDAAWPKQLERLLRACAGPDAPRFETQNLGVPGYNVTQVVERLRGVGLRQHPDLAVYGYVLNDPQTYSLEARALDALEERAQARLRDAVRREGGRLLARSRLYLLARQTWAQWGREPAFYDLDAAGAVRARDDGRAVDVDPGMDPGHRAIAVRGDRRGAWFRALHRSPAGRERLARGLDALAAIARREVPVALVIFPLFLVPHAGPYPLADVHDAVARAAAGRGLPVRDLAPAFAGAARALGAGVGARDFVHPDVVGHRLAAHVVAAWLVEAGLVPAGTDALSCLGRASASDPRVARALSAGPLSGARSAARGSPAR